MIGTYVLFGFLALVDAGFMMWNAWLWWNLRHPIDATSAVAGLISLAVVLIFGRMTIRVKRETEAIRRETEALYRSMEDRP